MSLYGKAVYSILKADTAITAITGLRIYPNVIPQTARERSEGLPVIVFEKISNNQDHNMGNDNTPEHPLYTIHCLALTYFDAETLRDAVISAMNNYNGDIGGATIQWIFMENNWDNYIAATDTHDLMVDFRVWADRT